MLLDSTKLLCLTAQGKSKEDVSSLKSAFKVGLNSEMQWTVFNFPLQELGEYDSFKPTPYFMVCILHLSPATLVSD